MNEEPTSSAEKVKRKRGPITMPRVVKARSHGEVKEVTYNRRGQSEREKSNEYKHHSSRHGFVNVEEKIVSVEYFVLHR